MNESRMDAKMDRILDKHVRGLCDRCEKPSTGSVPSILIRDKGSREKRPFKVCGGCKAYFREASS